jgi:hypothetical protein
MMSAVQARIHYSMKQEFRLLKEIIRDYTPPDYSYEPEDGNRMIKQSDYDQVDVIPVSDPNAATMAQKVVQYQAALQLAQTAPQLYDLPLLHRQMLDVLGIKNYQKLVPMAEDLRPMDPVAENQNILKQKPVQAFIEQNHQAHIAVHMAPMQDPKIQQLLSMNPQMAQQLQMTMMAHINEHLGFEYRLQVEKAMGMQLPPMPKDGEQAKPMPPEMADQIAQMAAQASQQLLQQNQQQAQAQQNQQQAQDPIIQMQQQELQIKAAEQQRKAAKDLIDAQLKQEQIAVERERIQAQQQTAGAQAAVKAMTDKQAREDAQRLEGSKAGLELMKLQQTLAHNTAKEQTKRGR